MNEYIDNNEYTESSDSIRERRQQRMRQMQQRKKQQMMMRRYIRAFGPLAAVLVVVLVLIIGGGRMVHKAFAKEEQTADVVQTESAVQTADAEQAADVVQEESAVQTADAVQAESSGAADNVQATSQTGNTSNRSIGNSALALQAASNIYMAAAQTVAEEMKEPQQLYSAQETAQTRSMSGEIGSSYGIFLDPVNDEILAQRLATTRMNPASMTKVLTVLVAAEHVEETALDDPFTITLEITDYGYSHDCSSAGFERDEIVTVRDLFYGTILPSGADAAMGLAVYVAGDHETFVEMMNQKLEELGLSESAHVTNCVGVYDDDHYCTAYDMAMIMEAALDNELCREVMTAHTYTTSVTEQHPEGMILSNWFLRRIEDRDTGGEVICAKTGYVKEAGSCAVSFGQDKAGNEYICVTAGAENQWKCISDHEKLYKAYAEGDD